MGIDTACPSMGIRCSRGFEGSEVSEVSQVEGERQNQQPHICQRQGRYGAPSNEAPDCCHLANVGTWASRVSDLYCFHYEQVTNEIERLFGLGMDAKKERGALETFLAFREGLSRGELRAAEKRDGRWQANVWVKQGILLGFRLGVAEETHAGDTFTFVDRHTFPVRQFKCGDGVRMVPGGSTVREGAYLAPGVICMPPMYVNVGAYVDEGTMIDSHALVGSCAQVGQAGACERGVADRRSAGAGERQSGGD